MERRLTTILAADVVGYSRLMEVDEVATLAALKAHRQELIDPLISEHAGRVVKLMGDGAIVEFRSVVDAMACALEIQKGISDRSSDVPEDKRILLRIGVHIGDVMVEGDDLYGDGVNVAARLEALAQPNTICISQQVFDQIEGKMELAFQDLGEQNFKNISRPIRAYQTISEPVQHKSVNPMRRSSNLRLVKSAVLLVAILGATIVWYKWRSEVIPQPSIEASQPQSVKSSLAVLPFSNMSNDAEQDYFADGMTEDLITDLAQISGLVVIARNSTFTYKGQNPDVQDVAKDLKVRYVVEGSIRKAGERIRITAQLVDAETGAHVWAERYDRNVVDVFDLQDEVRARIVSALKVKLTPTEKKRLARKLTTNPEAYDAYLRGLQQESYFTKEGNRESVRLFEQAVKLDPNFVAAMGRLATALTVAADNNFTEEPQQALARARIIAERAVEMDDNLPQAHWALARIYSRRQLFDGDRAIASLRRAIELDPNYADGHAMLANILIFVGEADKGIEHIKIAMRLNPHFPFWYHYVLGASQHMVGDYHSAVESFNKAVERNPNWRPSRLYLVSAYGHLGMVDEAEWEIEELKALGFDPTIENFDKRVQIQDPTYRKKFFESLRKLGIPEK